MLTCQAIIDFLMDYESGELPPEQRGEFERHLKVCPPCVAFLESYKKTIALEKDTAECKSPELPDELVQAILASRGQAK